MKIGVDVYTYKLKHSGVWGKGTVSWRPVLDSYQDDVSKQKHTQALAMPNQLKI